MNMQFRKAVGDVKRNWLSMTAILVVLILGAAGVMAALNAREVLSREIAKNFAQSQAPDLTVWFDEVDVNTLQKIAALDGVAAVDTRRTALMRVRAKDGTWLPLKLTVKPDFDAQKLEVIHTHKGLWSNDGDGLYIEQSGRTLLGYAVEDSLQLRTALGDIHTAKLRGYAHDQAVAPSQQDRVVYGYLTPQTAAKIGLQQGMNQLIIKLQAPVSHGSKASFATRLEKLLIADGSPALRIETLSGTHPHGLLMASLLRVMAIFAALALLGSAAMANYLVGTWMRREVRQMGIMKALGARTGQIIVQYLLVLLPALALAVVLAVPLGDVFANALVTANIESLNIDVLNWRVPASLRLQEIALAFFLPLLAMFLPLARAARLTVRQAIHDPGITSSSSLMTTILVRYLKLPLSVRNSYALRNVVRRPWRTIVITVALGCGGALLMTTNSMIGGLMQVIDRNLESQGHDIEITLSRAAPKTEVEAIARSVGAVSLAESMRRIGVKVLADGNKADARIHHDGDSTVLVDYPTTGAAAELFKLPLGQGRSPRGNTDNEVLATQMFMNGHGRLKLGDIIVLGIDGRRISVRVVGVVEEIAVAAIYAPASTYDAITRSIGGENSLVNGVRIKSKNLDFKTVVAELDRAFLAAKLPPRRIASRADLRESLEEHFKVVVDVVRIVALAVALLGAVILCATTALNIAERCRELGILRSLGATPSQIARLFFIESFAVASLSVLLALALSSGLTFAIFKAAQRTLLHVNVPMYFSWTGLLQVAAGLVIVIFTVWVVLCWTLRQSVREALSYE